MFVCVCVCVLAQPLACDLNNKCLRNQEGAQVMVLWQKSAEGGVELMRVMTFLC